MTLEDMQAFMKVAPSELPDTLFLQTPESDPTSKEPIVKIRDLNSIYIEAGDTFSVEYQKGLYVDIFPFIDYPTVPRPWAKKLCKGISVSYSILHAQHYYSLRSFAEFFYFGMKYALFKGIWAMLCLVRPQGTYLSIYSSITDTASCTVKIPSFRSPPSLSKEKISRHRAMWTPI